VSPKPPDSRDKNAEHGDKSVARNKISTNSAIDIKREGDPSHTSKYDNSKSGITCNMKGKLEMKNTIVRHEKAISGCNGRSSQLKAKYPDIDEEEDEGYDDEDEDDEYSDDDDDDEDDEYDESDDDQVTGYCLHCRLPPPPSDGSGSSTPTALGIQVSCDECHAFICSSCHWCHEFQANHEIRVCDRCDAFFCKACDEMDQCEDCGEVVCTGCGSLCSCKFCGCGLCEECATACGR